MNATRLILHNYRYFPYERILAEREARVLFGKKPKNDGNGFSLDCAGLESIANRLTYFKAVETSEGTIIPDQAKLEASGNGNGHAWNPLRQPIPNLRRQITRYSAHGLHEYRGKFNPQIVRTIGNLIGLEPGAWVFDPFCGSGTTLLEAAHIGWHAFGMDINPLAVLIANTKILAFNASPRILSRECAALAERLSPIPDGSHWIEHLPEPDYLERWFPIPVLQQLWAILEAIEETNPRSLQDVFRVVLSDICREVSLQDPGDLRVRRRKNPARNYPVVQMFLDSLQAKVASIVRARQHVQPKRDTQQFAFLGDTRNAAESARAFLAEHCRDTFDGAITSPPYATAMPYLDTQRLSLALLGLIGSRQLRTAEKRVIGNRDIQDRERTALEGLVRSNAAGLPNAVIAFCELLLKLAHHADHGFRRRNVPALVYKYLADMANMFESVRHVIRSKGRFALLVGRNSTKLRGKEIVIDTPELLAAVAKSRGWHVEEMLAFETYHRYDLHKRNSIREESLLVLTNT